MAGRSAQRSRTDRCRRPGHDGRRDRRGDGAGRLSTSSASSRPTRPVGRGRGHVERSTDRAVARGRLSEADQQALIGRIRFTSSLEDARGRAARRRSRGREARPQAGDLRQARVDLLSGHGAGDEHLRLSVTEIAAATHHPGRVVGHALLQPGAGAAARRDRPHRRHRAGRRGRRRRPRPATGQAAGRGRRQGGVHRERTALRLPQPRGAHVRAAPRHPGGPGRRDDAGLRPAHGAARAPGPHRPRHGVRDPADDVPPGPRPAACAGAAAPAARRRRPPRPQDRPRFLPLRRAGLPDRGAGPGRALDPGSRGTGPRRPLGRGGGLGDDGDRHRRGVRRGRLRGAARWGPVRTRGRRGWRTSPPSTSSSRRSRTRSTSSGPCSASSTRSAGPGPCSRRPRPCCASSRAPRPPRAPGTSSACTSSILPPRRPRRGRRHRRHGAGRRRHRARRRRAARQARRPVRGPRRVRRERAALPVPQRRGAHALPALRLRRRHRHRHEGRLRLPRGPLRGAGRRRARRRARRPVVAVPESREPGHAPAPLLEQLALAGRGFRTPS